MYIHWIFLKCPAGDWKYYIWLLLSYNWTSIYVHNVPSHKILFFLYSTRVQLCRQESKSSLKGTHNTLNTRYNFLSYINMPKSESLFEARHFYFISRIASMLVLYMFIVKYDVIVRFSPKSSSSSSSSRSRGIRSFFIIILHSIW